MALLVSLGIEQGAVDGVHPQSLALERHAHRIHQKRHVFLKQEYLRVAMFPALFLETGVEASHPGRVPREHPEVAPQRLNQAADIRQGLAGHLVHRRGESKKMARKFGEGVRAIEPHLGQAGPDIVEEMVVAVFHAGSVPYRTVKHLSGRMRPTKAIPSIVLHGDEDSRPGNRPGDRDTRSRARPTKKPGTKPGFRIWWS